MNGGGIITVVVKADVKYSDASRNKALHENMVEKLNEVIQKIRNRSIPRDDEMIGRLQQEDIEIFKSFIEREVVVWIWCQSQKALECVQKAYKSNLLADVLTTATRDPSLYSDIRPKLIIDKDHLKKEIVRNTLMLEIEENIEFLIESIDLSPTLLNRLRADGSLTRKEIDDILHVHQPARNNMNSALLQFILTKWRSSQLIEALNETNQHDIVTLLSKMIFLCGPNGPSAGCITISTRHTQDAPSGPSRINVVGGAVAGFFGAVAGGIRGFFVERGKPTAVLSHAEVLGGKAFKAVTMDKLPEKLDSETKSKLVRVRINKAFLGNYRRQKHLNPDYDNCCFMIRSVDGHNLLYWNFDKFYHPVLLDLEKPNVAFVSQYLGYTMTLCRSEFSLNAAGDVEEWVPQQKRRWVWKKE